jgi:hypothetical protein
LAEDGGRVLRPPVATPLPGPAGTLLMYMAAHRAKADGSTDAKSGASRSQRLDILWGSRLWTATSGRPRLGGHLGAVAAGRPFLGGRMWAATFARPPLGDCLGAVAAGRPSLGGRMWAAHLCAATSGRLPRARSSRQAAQPNAAHPNATQPNEVVSVPSHRPAEWRCADGNVGTHGIHTVSRGRFTCRGRNAQPGRPHAPALQFVRITLALPSQTFGQQAHIVRLGRIIGLSSKK